MYTRIPPKSNKPKPKSDLPPDIQLPKNYSGNAFTSDGRKATLTPIASEKNGPQSAKPPKRPQISPSVTPVIPNAERLPSPPQYIPEASVIQREIFNKDALSEETPAAKPPGSLFSSILPNGIFKNNFPFAHGLGEEELLILGVMLALYTSGDEHGDLLLLLAILLFAG